MKCQTAIKVLMRYIRTFEKERSEALMKAEDGGTEAALYTAEANFLEAASMAASFAISIMEGKPQRLFFHTFGYMQKKEMDYTNAVRILSSLKNALQMAMKESIEQVYFKEKNQYQCDAAAFRYAVSALKEKEGRRNT